MTLESILQACKTACRLGTESVNSEITDLITAAYYDLEISGVADENGEPYYPETTDRLVLTAVKTYVKLHFGDLLTDTQWAKLKQSYDEQKAQLKMRRFSGSTIEPGPEPGPVPTGLYVKKTEMESISNEEIDEFWEENGE